MTLSLREAISCLDDFHFQDVDQNSDTRLPQWYNRITVIKAFKFWHMQYNKAAFVKLSESLKCIIEEGPYT